MMKIVVGMISIYFCVFLLRACGHRQEEKNIKDLNDNMMDLRIYLENLGDHIKSGKLKEGEWLLTDMDSILRLISKKFDTHRKLPKPFSYYYKKRLKEPIRKIQKGINADDTALARKNYYILVRKCNGCHIDHDIDKEVKY